jgi:polar amino acid transport system substrate-binding protein
MTGFTGRIARALVLSLVALLVFSLPMAAPAVADQCAPPGLDSASTVPTNLASAAAGPGEDKYTTPTVAPLDTVKVDTLGLGTPGVLTVGTLSDAPPSICIDSAGQFTGFDNELLRAMAEKIGLRVNFVGTEFSGLLAQVASRRFDVGSSSITTTDARRKTASTSSPRASGSASSRAPFRRPTSSTRCIWIRSSSPTTTRCTPA